MSAIINNIRGYVTERNIKFAVRVILGGVFIIAGISKFIDPKLLFAQLSKAGILNEIFSNISAYGLITFETILGLMLILYFRQWIAITTSAILTGFCLFLAYLVYTHDPTTCGCFGNFVRMSNHKELSLDLLLLFGAIYIT